MSTDWVRFDKYDPETWPADGTRWHIGGPNLGQQVAEFKREEWAKRPEGAPEQEPAWSSTTCDCYACEDRLMWHVIGTFWYRPLPPTPQEGS